jgi:hypothetical protein
MTIVRAPSSGVRARRVEKTDPMIRAAAGEFLPSDDLQKHGSRQLMMISELGVEAAAEMVGLVKYPSLRTAKMTKILERLYLFVRSIVSMAPSNSASVSLNSLVHPIEVLLLAIPFPDILWQRFWKLRQRIQCRSHNCQTRRYSKGFGSFLQFGNN